METDPNSLHRITLQLPVPVQDSKTILKLLQLELQAHPPKAPVKKVLLTIEAAPPRKIQRDLFTPPGPEPQRMELSGSDQAMPEPAWEYRAANTYRPDAFQMQGFSLAEETLGAGVVRLRLLKAVRNEYQNQEAGGTPALPGTLPALPHSALRRFRPAIPARVGEDAQLFVTFLNQRRKVLAQAGPGEQRKRWVKRPGHGMNGMSRW
jgi:hypothetical protein